MNNQKARRLRKKFQKDKNIGEASRLRSEGDRCLHGDEIKNYLSEEEAAADMSPKIICADCGKQKLRVKWVTDRAPHEKERRLFEQMLKEKNRK